MDHSHFIPVILYKLSSTSDLWQIPSHALYREPGSLLVVPHPKIRSSESRATIITPHTEGVAVTRFPKSKQPHSSINDTKKLTPTIDIEAVQDEQQMEPIKTHPLGNVIIFDEKYQVPSCHFGNVEHHPWGYLLEGFGERDFAILITEKMRAFIQPDTKK